MSNPATNDVPAVSRRAVLTAIGTDRPGLVEELTEFLFAQGGNIEDSRMSNLSGQFAMMLLVSGDASTFAKINGGLGTFAHRSGLRAEIHPAEQSPPKTPAMPYRLTTTAMDQAGLVHRIAHLIRELGINIENLETHLTAAPYTGAPTFELDLAMAVPRNVPISQLREKLATLCDDLNIDWRLEAV